jgi:putative holliday junction resolvase
MGRIIAIDYGSKRVGLAVTDPERIIATALETLPPNSVLDYLTAYLKKEQVDVFVVGQPMGMKSGTLAIEEQILAFIRALNKRFPDLPVERHDERYTSKMAFQTMIDAGLKKSVRRDKALVDRVSAVIILQSYLGYLQNKLDRS